MRNFVKSFVFIFVGVWGNGALVAQQDAGTIEGIISDQSDAELPKAQVILRNTGTGQTRTMQTGQAGQYVFTPVAAGNYELTVSALGFQTEVRRNLELQVQQKLDVNIRLLVGAQSKAIEVTTTAPPLQTADSSLGQVVDTEKIVSLPLNGRNVYQLITLTPGSAAGPRGRPTVSGQTPQNQYYGLDGMDNNNYQGGYASNNAYNLSPSPDGVEEFKVQTNNYSAEFGQSAGGVINVITRSGTNQPHGSLYEFIRNDKLDARNFFATNNPPYKQNQYGGSLGAPIVIPKIIDGHDKLFFFADLEGFRSRKGQTTDVTMPSTAWREGNFQNYLTGTTYNDPCTGAVYNTGQLFDPTSTHQVTCTNGTTAFERNPIVYNGQPNVINPAQISPVAKAALALVPAPNFGSNQYIWSPTVANDYVRGDSKVDYQWKEHDHIFGRYGILDSPVSTTAKNKLPSFPGPASPGSYTVGRQQGVAIGDTHIFSPTTINEFRFGWTRNTTDILLFGTDLNASTLGFNGLPYQSGFLGGLPELKFSDVGGFGASSPVLYTARNAQFVDTLNLVRGKHTFKMGFQYNRYSWLQFGSSFPVGYYDFTGALTKSLSVGNVDGAAAKGSGFAQFLFGIPDSSGLSNSIVSDNLRWTGAVFAQDDWKVSSKLTINAGLRWEFGSPLGERQNRVAGIDLESGAFEIPKSRENISPSLPPGIPVEYVNSNTLFKNATLNFGPRLGFAYRLDTKTVIRAAGGIFFANPFPAGTAGYPLNPPFAVIGSVQAPATGPISPVTGSPVVPVTNIASGFPSTFFSNLYLDPSANQFYLYDKKPLYPTTNNWNFAVQRELPGSVVLEVAYAGSKSTHVVAGNDLNQPYPTSNSNLSPQDHRPYPNLGPFGFIFTGADAHYNSLQVKAEKRYTNGLTFLFAYTWSHSIDDAASGAYTTAASSLEYYDFYRDARNISIDKGDSYFDIRNRWVLSSLYDLPVGHGRMFGNSWSNVVNQILGGWRLGGILQFQTGFHFGAITYNDPCNCLDDSYVGAAVPNLAGSPYDFSYGQAQQAAEGCPVGHQSVQCWVNPAAFVSPAAGQIGNEGRNTLVGPNLFNLDLSISKEFPIHERAHLEFRGEFFNVTNHPNFAIPQNTAEASNFGALTSTATDGRDIQFALRLAF